MSAAKQGETETVDQIREIIFGDQMRSYDSRFAMMEGQIRRELQTVNTEVEKTMTSAEASLRAESEKIRRELAIEASERREEIEKMKGDFETALGQMETINTRIDRQYQEVERRLNLELQDQSKALHKELHDSVSDLTSFLESELRGIRVNKVEAIELSNTLHQLADSLAKGESLNSRPRADAPKETEEAKAEGKPATNGAVPFPSSNEGTNEDLSHMFRVDNSSD